MGCRGQPRAVAVLLLVLGLSPCWAIAQEGEEPEARALLTPRQEAVLSAELAGRIAALPVEEGMAFAEGDVLVRFACDLHEAALAEERASNSAARATLENHRQLAALRSAGALDVSLAEAEVRRTAARVTMQQGMVNRCQITAPFAGRVVSWHARPHESVAAGSPLLSILDDSALDLELVVPSPWLAWLRNGTALRVRVDETGTIHAAQVRGIGARIDAVSQSVPIKASFVEAPQSLLAGMSGTALFEPGAGAQ